VHRSKRIIGGLDVLHRIMFVLLGTQTRIDKAMRPDSVKGKNEKNASVALFRQGFAGARIDMTYQHCRRRPVTYVRNIKLIS
jgi:hypothetical protein